MREKFRPKTPAGWTIVVLMIVSLFWALLVVVTSALASFG